MPSPTQKLIDETLFLDDNGIPMEEKMKQTQTPKSSDKCICGHLKSEHGWFDRFTGKKHNSCTYTFNKGTDMSRGCDCKHFKLFKQKEGYCENINSVCEELTSARKALSEQKKEYESILKRLQDDTFIRLNKEDMFLFKKWLIEQKRIEK